MSKNVYGRNRGTSKSVRIRREKTISQERVPAPNVRVEEVKEAMSWWRDQYANDEIPYAVYRLLGELLEEALKQNE